MTDDYVTEPGQAWSVDLFRPEDAEGVTRLFLAVYGPDYPIRTYVEPELLRRENAVGRIISSVARTGRGDIVGHNALFHSAPCHKICETGAGVVHRDYRGGHGIFTDMVAHGIEVGKSRGLGLIFGEPVCNHVFSQRLCHGLGFFTRALEVDLMPAAAYSKEQSAVGRVSTTLAFRSLQPHPHTVYLPSIYESQLHRFYEAFDDRRDFAPAAEELPAAGATELDVQVFAFAGVARIAVNRIGADLASVLAAREAELADRGVVVFQYWLRLAQPEVGAAARIMKQAGFFCGGVLPRWFDEDGLLMQKILGRPNWEGMQIHYPEDRELLAMVRADWESTVQA